MIKSSSDSPFSLEAYEAIFDNPQLGIVILSSECLVLKANDLFCRMLGIMHSDIIGQHIQSIDSSPDNSLQTFIQQIERLQTTSTFKSDLQLTRKDESTLWCKLSGTLLFKGSEQTGYALFFTDINDLIRSKDELSKSKSLMHNIFDSIPGMIIVIDKEFNIIKLSKQYQDGMRVFQEYEGKKCYSVIKDKPFVCPECVARLAIEEGQTHTRFSTSYEESITGRAFKMFTAPLHDENGAIIGAIEHFIDITDLRRTQEQLVAARNQAEEATKAKSLFLANMSHEIRNPLNGIIGMLDLALGGQLGARERAHLELAREASTKLSRILGDILDLSKLESSSLRVHKESFGLEAFMHNMFALHASQARPKGIALNLHIDPDVPQCIVTDPTRLSQVISNLLSNAIKFTDHGSIKVHVSLFHHQGMNKLLFSVQDSGVGIPQDSLEMIFHSFTQLDESTNKSFQGTGLGLAISKMLVRLLGGDIWAKSTSGEGSVFSFYIDYEGQHCRVPSHTEKHPQTSPSDISGLCVLVVEDDPLNSYYAKTILQQAKVNTVLAEDGTEAIKQLASRHFDLVLTDIQLPEMDGVDIVTRLRCDKDLAANQHIPVVAVTGYSDNEQIQDYLDSGLDDVILKPYTAKDITETIAKHTMNVRTRLKSCS